MATRYSSDSHRLLNTSEIIVSLFLVICMLFEQ